MTDETTQITTFNRDVLDRIEETLYPDGSKTQVWRDDVNEIVYQKDRNDVVSRQDRDTSHRVSVITDSYGHDTDILDESIATVHSVDRTERDHQILSGWPGEDPQGGY